jgi:uncharacterized repeat protein (TIGR01451 family)
LSIVNCAITNNEAFQGGGGSGGQGGQGGAGGVDGPEGEGNAGANGGDGGSGGQGGNAFGGGIYNAGGSLVIQGSMFTSNFAGVSGFLFGNVVGGGNGGDGGPGGDGLAIGGGPGGNGGNGGFAGDDFGGAIYNSSSGSVAITTSSFSQNSAIGETGGQAGAGTTGGSGGGGSGAGGTGGSAGDASGGAIDNQGTMTIDSSSFFNNQAVGNNGGPGGAGAAGDDFGAVAPGGAGGTGGSAGDASGGAIDNQGTMTIDNSSFFKNQAIGTNGGPGGAGGTGADSLEGGPGGMGGNAGNGGFGGADFAGAIESFMGSLTLTHSTVSLNSAASGAGGVAGAEGAGGSGTMTGPSGGPGSNGASGSAGDGGIQSVSAKSQLFDTIVAGDTASVDPDVSGHFLSLGHNLIGNATGSSGFTASGDQVGVNPMLGPPGNHGGPTPTMVPMVGSPAIDAGDNANAPSTDQRGLPRIADGDNNVDHDGPVIDIGAVEFQPTDVSITAKGSPGSVSPGGTITYTITVRTGKGDNTVTKLALSDSVPAQTTFESFTAPVGWIVTAPAAGHAGTVTASFVSLGQNATASFTLKVKASTKPSASSTTNTSTITTTSPDPTLADTPRP